MWPALRRIAPYLMLAVLPVAALITEAVVAHRTGDLGPDFRYELYPEARLILHGVNPFPPQHADLSLGGNRVFPVPGALLFAPLTALPASLAADVLAAVLVAVIALAAWVLGVRDWRVYGVVGLWPATLAAMQTGNLIAPLTLLVALAWRYRARRYLPGIAIGLAIALKLFLWPLLVWLVAIRSYRSAILGAALGVGGGLLLVLPFTSLAHYLSLLDGLSRISGPQSLNLVGLLTQAHLLSFRGAEIAASSAGLIVLALAYARRSFPLALATALLISPIVWNNYYVLLLVPLAISSRSLSPAWFVPLALWVVPGNGTDVRLWHVVVSLAVLACVTVHVEWGPRSRGRRATVAKPADVRSVAS